MSPPSSIPIMMVVVVVHWAWSAKLGWNFIIFNGPLVAGKRKRTMPIEGVTWRSRVCTSVCNAIGRCSSSIRRTSQSRWPTTAATIAAWYMQLLAWRWRRQRARRWIRRRSDESITLTEHKIARIKFSDATYICSSLRHSQYMKNLENLNPSNGYF